MNIQKIFEELKNDEDNSALGIICSELEKQGYKVSVNSKEVNSKDFFEGELDELEKGSDKFFFSLTKNGEVEQLFNIQFIDFHKIIFCDHRND